jgi:transcriptional regulator with XRE-family HTH domain
MISPPFFRYRIIGCIRKMRNFAQPIICMLMETKPLNRIKVILAEKNKTNKWLAEQLGKDPATVSKWVTNVSQPSLELRLKIARCLNVELQSLVRGDAIID